MEADRVEAQRLDGEWREWRESGEGEWRGRVEGVESESKRAPTHHVLTQDVLHVRCIYCVACCSVRSWTRTGATSAPSSVRFFEKTVGARSFDHVCMNSLVTTREPAILQRLVRRARPENILTHTVSTPARGRRASSSGNRSSITSLTIGLTHGFHSCIVKHTEAQTKGCET